MKTLNLIIFLLCYLMMGCSNQEKYPEGTAAAGDSRAVDLSMLTLPGAVKTKYSRLQLVCNYEYSIAYKDVANGVTSVITSAPKYDYQVIWDLLEDPATEKTLIAHFGDETLPLTLILKLKLSLKSGLFQIGNVPDAAKLLNAAFLSGEFTTRTSNLSYRFGTTGSTYFADRIPTVLEDGSVGKGEDDKATSKLTCTVKADVKAGYENDFILTHKDEDPQ